MQFVCIPTHFLKLKKITTGKNCSTDNYICLKHSEHFEYSEFLNLPYRVFLQLIHKLSQRRFLMKFRRNLMCVGRYAAKVMRKERSEMEHNQSEMPAKVTKQICIPAGCDYAIKVQLMLSHSYGMQNINISIAGICPNKFERAKGSKRFHFASLHYIFSAYLPTHIKSLRDFFNHY